MNVDGSQSNKNANALETNPELSSGSGCLVLDLNGSCSPTVHETNISNFQLPDSTVQLASKEHLIYLFSVESVIFVSKKDQQMKLFLSCTFIQSVSY